MKLTSATVGQLDRVSEISSAILVALSALGPVVADQLGVNIDVCYVVDDATNLQTRILQQVPQQSGFACARKSACSDPIQ